jgi:hypothetical protein
MTLAELNDEKGLNDGRFGMMSPHAVAPFGEVTPVLDANCEFERAGGDCVVDGQGTIHVFVFFSGGSCDQELLITYVSGSGGSWTPATTPYRGWVLGMAIDGTQLFLLFSNSDGIHLGQLGTGAIHPQPDVEPALATGVGARRRTRRGQLGSQGGQVVGRLVGTGRSSPDFPSVPGVHDDLHR